VANHVSITDFVERCTRVAGHGLSQQ
jgi:hypothetical protein